MNGPTPVTDIANANGEITTAPNTNELPEKSGASRAILSCELVLSSEETQRIFRRTFKATERNLYAIDVLTSIKLGNEVNQKLLSIVDLWMTQIREDLQSERERVTVLYDQLNLSETATYSSPVRVRIEWATPFAKRYADMLLKLDELLRIVNTLWLHDALPPVQNRVYSWQQRFMRLAGRLRALASLVRHQITKSRDLRPHQIELSEHLRNAMNQALAEDVDQSGINVEEEDLSTSAKAIATAAIGQAPPIIQSTEEKSTRKAKPKVRAATG